MKTTNNLFHLVVLTAVLFSVCNNCQAATAGDPFMDLLKIREVKEVKSTPTPKNAEEAPKEPETKRAEKPEPKSEKEEAPQKKEEPKENKKDDKKDALQRKIRNIKTRTIFETLFGVLAGRNKKWAATHSLLTKIDRAVQRADKVIEKLQREQAQKGNRSSQGTSRRPATKKSARRSSKKSNLSAIAQIKANLCKKNLPNETREILKKALDFTNKFRSSHQPLARAAMKFILASVGKDGQLRHDAKNFIKVMDRITKKQKEIDDASNAEASQLLSEQVKNITEATDILAQAKKVIEAKNKAGYIEAAHKATLHYSLSYAVQSGNELFDRFNKMIDSHNKSREAREELKKYKAERLSKLRSYISDCQSGLRKGRFEKETAFNVQDKLSKFYGEMSKLEKRLKELKSNPTTIANSSPNSSTNKG